MEDKQKTHLSRLLALMMAVVLAVGLARAITPAPARAPGGPSALFAAGSTPAPEEEAPLTVAYFGDLTQPSSAYLATRLEEAAEEKNWEIVTYNTKNRELIAQNQIKNAAQFSGGGVAILENIGENTGELAQQLKDSGYAVITLFYGRESTENRAIRANIVQDWPETAELLQSLLTDGPQGRYLLFPDSADPALENSVYETVKMERYFTVYSGKSEQTAHDYALYCFQTRPDLTCLLTQSSSAARGAALAAEEAEGAILEGAEGQTTFRREGVRLGALSLDDAVLELLDEGRLDFALGVGMEDVFTALTDLLPGVAEGRYMGETTLSPTLVTPATAASYRFGY